MCRFMAHATPLHSLLESTAICSPCSWEPPEHKGSSGANQARRWYHFLRGTLRSSVCATPSRRSWKKLSRHTPTTCRETLTHGYREEQWTRGEANNRLNCRWMKWKRANEREAVHTVETSVDVLRRNLGCNARKLEVAEMNMLLCICGITRSNMVRHEKIRTVKVGPEKI